jgi:hypothetical protein
MPPRDWEMAKAQLPFSSQPDRAGMMNSPAVDPGQDQGVSALPLTACAQSQWIIRARRSARSHTVLCCQQTFFRPHLSAQVLFNSARCPATPALGKLHR